MTCQGPARHKDTSSDFTPSLPLNQDKPKSPEGSPGRLVQPGDGTGHVVDRVVREDMQVVGVVGRQTGPQVGNTVEGLRESSEVTVERPVGRPVDQPFIRETSTRSLRRFNVTKDSHRTSTCL